MIVKWQDIVRKMDKKRISKRLTNEIVRNFYHAFKSSIDSDTDIDIKGIGTFKATWQSKASERAQKAYNKPAAKYHSKMESRRKRMWTFEKFDNYWEEQLF